MSDLESDAELRAKLRALSVEDIRHLAGGDPRALAGLVLMDLSGASFIEDPTVWRRWGPLIRNDDVLYAAIEVCLSELHGETPHQRAVIDAFCGAFQLVRELSDPDFDMWLADTTSAGALERRRTLTTAGT